MKTVLKFAISSLALATLAIGCKPASTRPASLSDKAPRAEVASANVADKARAALTKRDVAKAVELAERAVAMAPRNAAHRALLGQAYLAAGRFASAQTSFRDALSLDPQMGRAALSLSLAETAQGHPDAALATLGAARDVIPPSDLGLALALAGDHDGAIAVLEPAARADGATAKTRQNLALAYALAGRWKESHATAMVDVSPAEMPMRMMRWAQIARPGEPMAQVASLLGVTPVADPGQPTALVLAPVETPAQVAEAAPVEAVAAVEPAPVVQAPEQVAEAAPVAIVPVEVTPLATPAVAEPAPAPAFAEAEVRAQDSIFAQAKAPATVMQVAVAESAPARAAERSIFRVARPAPAVRSFDPNAGYVVQLGAFSTSARVEAAWGKAVSKTRTLAKYEPASMKFLAPGRSAAVYRLSVGGFPTRNDASRLCQNVRSAGGDCFVRGVAGDAPLQWAAKARGQQFASR